jgi:hypothetical protein
MQTKHFYELWDADEDGAFPIEQFGNLPEFCKPSLKEGNAAFITYIDGWDVSPSGDAAADLKTGHRFAEMTVAYARKNGSPAFIAFVLDALQFKTVSDGVGALTAIEYGFFERIAQITYCGSLN